MGKVKQDKQRVIWQPQPRQAAFLSRPEYEAMYGGAAGGGKSDALLVEALRQVHIPHYRGVIFRKTFRELSDLVDRSREIYAPAYPRAKFNASTYIWSFPSGAKVYFDNMQDTAYRQKYQGRHFDFIGFDELTHFTWDEYSYMMSRNRPNGPGTICYIRGATNPGGIGHGWVKERFVTSAPPMTPIKEDVVVHGPEGDIHMMRDRIFVPATVFDNKVLLSNDPNYLASMAMMPEAERNALLYGSWDSFDGQVFREWRNDPAHYQDRRWTHVIAPFKVPKWWRVYRGFDFGYAKPFSVGWYAVDGDGRIYRIQEYYGCTGTPNQGIKLNPVEIAAEIKRIEEEDPNLRGRDIEGIADPSIFDASRGESIAAMMARHPNYIYWDKGSNARIDGKMQYHYRLAFDEDGLPMFYTFDICKHFIRTLPNLVYSQTYTEDVDTEGEDHIYDECRYILAANPLPARKNHAEKPVPWDPLDMYKDKLAERQQHDISYYAI